MLEPIRDKLQAGFQSEQMEVDKAWINRFRRSLITSKVDLLVELGHAELDAREVVNLKKGDVIPLEQYATDPLEVYVEGVAKYKAYPGIYKGSQAVQICEVISSKEGMDYGSE